MRIALLLFVTVVCTLADDTPWQARLQYIEACSCDLFCPCYLNDHASHQGTAARNCTFNMGTRVLTGKHGDVDLTGMKFWLSGDLGSDWGTKGQSDWLVVTFEPKATQAQKDGLMAVLTKLYPVKWSSVQMDTSEITWRISPDGASAYAKLANGKGELKLTRFAGAEPDKPAQVQNVKYFGAAWNSPFSLYHSDHYYKGFGKSYELHHANGFTITVEASSDGKRVQLPKKSD